MKREKNKEIVLYCSGEQFILLYCRVVIYGVVSRSLVQLAQCSAV